MALAVSKVVGADSVFGNKRIKVRDLAFSGTYPTGGETVTASDVDLNVIDQVLTSGAVSETDETGAWVTKVDYQTNGDVKFVLYEGAGTGVVFGQKPNEAYESASELRATFIGH